MSFSFLWSVTFSPDRQLGDWEAGGHRLEKYAFANVEGGGGGEMTWSDQWAPWFCFWKVEEGCEWKHGVLAGLLDDEVLLSPYWGLLRSNGNHNHPVVIWKPSAFIPLKGFLFCRFLVMLLPETLCQLMFACFWNGKRLLIASPTTRCSELAGALLAGHFPDTPPRACQGSVQRARWCQLFSFLAFTWKV